MDFRLASPTLDHFLFEPRLTELGLHYYFDLKSEEGMVAKNYLRHKKKSRAVQDMLTVYNLLDSDLLPSLKAVIQVALTIPVSCCSCERSFSALRRFHTWLKRTMVQQTPALGCDVN